jgi:hypothetical protein
MVDCVRARRHAAVIADFCNKIGTKRTQSGHLTNYGKNPNDPVARDGRHPMQQSAARAQIVFLRKAVVWIHLSRRSRVLRGLIDETVVLQ